MGRTVGEVPLEGTLVVRLRRVRDLEQRLVPGRLSPHGTDGATPSARLVVRHLTIIAERSCAWLNKAGGRCGPCSPWA